MTYLQNRKRLTDLENKLMVTRWEGSGWGIDWEVGIDIYTLQYFKEISNKGILCSPGKSAQ